MYHQACLVLHKLLKTSLNLPTLVRNYFRTLISTLISGKDPHIPNCVCMCEYIGIWGPTSDNYKETTRGFVPLCFGHSVQHNRDGLLGHSDGAQKACIHAWPWITQIFTMCKHTPIHRCYLKIWYVATRVYPNSPNTRTETSTAAFFCVHSDWDINTPETGDTGDSINKKKHTHTSKGPRTQPYLFCLQCS